MEREIAHTDAHPQEHADPRVHAQIRTGPGGGFLLGAGVTLLLAATAILLVPIASPSQAWIVDSLADRGVTSLPLFAAGVLFTGLWLAVRTSREHSIAAQYAAMSSGPVIENLSERLVDLRDGVQGLRIEFVYLKDMVKAHIERQNQTVHTDTHAEGMYRLAASLDQLGQRVEQQLGASQHELREKLESLWGAIEVIRHSKPDGRIHLGDDPAPDADSESPVETEHAAVPHPDAESQELATDHEAAASRERLGVLDLLDDLGRLLPKKTAPAHDHPMITPDAFEGVQDEGWDRHQTLAGPLPSLRLEGGREPSRVGGLLAGPDIHEPSDDLAIVRKLEELRVLLADSRVRDALTAMERIED